MSLFITIIHLIVGLGLLNVWLIRFNKKTDYRGKDAKNMVEEFAAYGLSKHFVYVIGFLKITAATLIIAGIWFDKIVFYPSLLLVLLMGGAVTMHLKVHDPPKKALPALSMLVLSAILAYYYWPF